MADTLKNIQLPANEWVDLYNHPVIVAAGITVGDVLRVKVIFGKNVVLFAGANKPTPEDGYEPATRDFPYINEATDTGAWVTCRNSDGLINVNKEG